MKDTWSRRWAAWLVAILLLAGGWLPASHAAAQASPGDGMVATVYPGSCEAPSPNDLAGFTAATPEAGGGDRDAVSFVARVDQSLTDLLSEPHVLLIERVDGDVATAFACGTIAADGEPDRVVVALESVETGGLAGVAVASSDDDGETAIVIFLLLDGGAAGAETAPAASDDDGVLDEPQEPDDERDGTEGGV